MEPYESLLTGNQNLLVSAIVFQQMAEFEYYSACVNSSEAHSRLGIFEPIIGIFFRKRNSAISPKRLGKCRNPKCLGERVFTALNDTTS